MKISMKHKMILSVVMFFMTAACVYSYPPDNAAVLYYQAAMLYEVADDMKEVLYDVAKGKIEVNDKAREFVKKNRLIINTLLDASELKNCDWGLDISQGIEMKIPHLSKMKGLLFLVATEAKIFAADADYDAALSRCMSLYRMARHINDRNYICYLVCIAINGITNDCLVQIVAEMPQHTQNMTRLKAGLIEIDSIPFSLKPAILGEHEAVLVFMTPEQLSIIARGEDKSVKEKLLALDSAAIDRNREYYTNHSAGIIDAFDMPYKEGYLALKALNKKVEEDIKEEPDVILTAVLHPAVAKIFSLSTRSKTYNNAIRAAVDLYLIKAKTGTLPDELPAGLPKDMFSGEDFEYVKTDGGFILRCQGKELGKDEIHEYKFEVK